MPRWRRLTLFVAVPAIVGGCGYWFWPSFKPRIGFAADVAHSPVHGLPASATNIHYYLAGFEGPAEAYDFNITESEFQAWAKSLSPPLVADGTASVHCVDVAHGPDGRHAITNGIIYSWRQEDQAVEAGYDRLLGRGYYYRSYR